MATETQTSRGQREAERLEAELDRLDQNTDRQAEQIRDARDRAVQAVERNTELNEVARKQRVDDERAKAKQHMERLRGEYTDSREAAIQGAQRALLGFAPAGYKDPARLMAFRDARDRAARLQDAREAEAALRTALEVGDSEQAEAICAHAFDRNWPSVWRAWPDRADGIELLAQLRSRRRAPNTLFRFSV